MANPVTWIYNKIRQAFQRIRGGKVEQTVKNTDPHADRYLYVANQEDMAKLMGRLKDGTSRQAFELEFRKLLKENYLAQYLTGKGGDAALQQSDYGRIGGMLAEQYKYLKGFIDDIWAGRYNDTPTTVRVKQLQARMEMYFRSAREAYGRGKALAVGFPIDKLPAIPGDGSSECRTNCLCSWVYDETETEHLATWTLSVAEHCPTCVRRSQEWNPFRIAKDLPTLPVQEPSSAASFVELEASRVEGMR